jgi:Leucine-rich repeat (LRR) protein
LDIRSFDLSSNSIEGTIPDLSSLKNMRYLYLGPNEFTSSIPAALYQLSRLTHLYLNNTIRDYAVEKYYGRSTRKAGMQLALRKVRI